MQPSVYSSETVRVLVGPDLTEFSVHKSLLCERCPFFQRALEGQFREADRREVELPEDSPDAFHEFLSWLYSSNVFFSDDDPQWDEMFKLWILADKLQLPKLQNLAMQKLLAKHERRAKDGAAGRFSTSTIQHVYEYTASDSPLRRFITDILAATMNSRQLRAWGPQYPIDLVQGLAIMWREQLGDLLKERRPFMVLSDTTPYMVSEDGSPIENKPKPFYLSGNPTIHGNTCCDGPLCVGKKEKQERLVGVRYRCCDCPDVDFCHLCKSHPQNSHNRDHKFTEVTRYNSSTVHFSVFCDGDACKSRVGQKGPIAGVRYKCTECKDYDLCQDCKRAQSETSVVQSTGPRPDRDVHLPDHILVAVQVHGKIHAPFLDRLTAEERKKRADDKQCINCAAYGHHVNDCEDAFCPLMLTIPPMED